MDMPYFAIVYAEKQKNVLVLHRCIIGHPVSWLLWLPVWFLNQTGLRLSGGDRFRM